MIFCILVFASAQKVFQVAKKTCPPPREPSGRLPLKHLYCVKYVNGSITQRRMTGAPCGEEIFGYFIGPCNLLKPVVISKSNA